MGLRLLKRLGRKIKSVSVGLLTGENIDDIQKQLKITSIATGILGTALKSKTITGLSDTTEVLAQTIGYIKEEMDDLAIAEFENEINADEEELRDLKVSLDGKKIGMTYKGLVAHYDMEDGAAGFKYRRTF
jgi:hypothetical protein